MTLNGTQYFQIQLNVNEPGGSKSLTSLDRLEFYTSATGSQTTTNVASLGTLRWSLDGAGDSYLLLDAARNNGSGSGDMFAYIPACAFAAVNGTDYIYMFSRFDDQVTADGATEGGFEEWALVSNLSAVPKVSALFPIVGLVTAIASTWVLRRRRSARLAEAELQG